MKASIELTDTFGREANYCWVKRYTLESADKLTDRQIIRRAKALAGVNCRHKKSDYGDMIRLDFAPAWLAVMFISFDY